MLELRPYQKSGIDKLRENAHRVMNRIEMIPESGCWIFMGALNEAGYGVVGIGGKNDRAHRIVYRFFVGETPTGMFVCHHCDVPSCCNPAHLFLGTARDNNDDMRRKKRDSKPPRNDHDVGSYRYNAKLDERMVMSFRERRLNGETGYALWMEAKSLLGISQGPFYRMLNKRSWRHV